MKKETIILLATLLILASVAYAETEPLLTRGDGRIILGLSNEVGLLRLRSTGSESSPQLILEDLDRVGVARLRTIDGDVFIEKSPDNQPFQSRIALTDDNTISLDNQNGNIILLPNGDVGIGTLIPEARLDVIGDILAGTTNSMTRLGSRGLELIGPTYEVGLVPNTDGSFGLTDDRAGVFRLLIDPIGNIGIGTVTPNKKLHVVGTTQSDDGILIGSDESDGNIFLTTAARNANRFLRFQAEDGSEISSIFQGDLSVSNQILFGNGLGRLTSQDGPKIQISDTENLATLSMKEGIFTLTGTPLQVPLLQLGDTGGNEVYWDIQEEPNNDMTFTYGRERISFTAAGNLGIGIAPTEALQVAGKARIQDTIINDNEINRVNGATNKDLHIGFRDTQRVSLLANGGRVGIGTTSPDRTLTVQGSVNIGGTTSGRLFVRHIDGKRAENAAGDNLFLQHNTGKDVIIGSNERASSLSVLGNTFVKGTTTVQGPLISQGQPVCLEDGTNCPTAFELLTCTVKTSAFNAGFLGCDAGTHRMAQWCSGDCSQDDAKAVICCPQKPSACEVFSSEDHGGNRQCPLGKSLVAAWCSGSCSAKDARASLCCAGPGLVKIEQGNYRSGQPGNVRSSAVNGRCTVHPQQNGLFACTEPSVTLFSYRNNGNDAGVTVCCPPSQMLDLGLYPK